MKRCPTCRLPVPRKCQSLKQHWTVKRCGTCGLVVKVIKTRRRRRFTSVGLSQVERQHHAICRLKAQVKRLKRALEKTEAR